ncbi:hypothetical protein [Gimesia sp.]|uniref:hypothetical protein n=1 Tax=Gimesia sp. TaxID=2024833 RepID=UPI003A8E66F9
MNQSITLESQRLDHSSSPGLSRRRLYLSMTLGLVLFICFVPLILKRWGPASLDDLIRSHGGEIEYSHPWTSFLGPQFGGIKSISIPNSADYQIDDEFINSLGEQRHLSVLTLGNAENPSLVTDQGLTALKNYPLQYLSITGGSFTDSGFNQLQKIPTLSTLSLYDSEITGEQLQTTPAWTKLEILQLSGSKITDNGLKNISAIPNLFFLNISNSTFDEDSFRHLSNLTKLSDLNLNNSIFSAGSLRHLAAIKSLRALTMQGNAINDDHVKQIANVKQITFLMLDHSKVTDQGLVALQKIKNLEQLFLSHTNITDAGVKHLTEIKTLQRLDLANTQITDAAMETLLQIPQLKELDLQDLRLSAATIESLRNAGIKVNSGEQNVVQQ